MLPRAARGKLLDILVGGLWLRLWGSAGARQSEHQDVIVTCPPPHDGLGRPFRRVPGRIRGIYGL